MSSRCRFQMSEEHKVRCPDGINLIKRNWCFKDEKDIVGSAGGSVLCEFIDNETCCEKYKGKQ